MHVMPKKFDPEMKARAVRMVRDQTEHYGSVTKAAEAVSQKLGIGRETLRTWVRRAEVDAGERDGVTSDELEQLRALRAEVKRLREDNEILRRAAVFFAGELDPRGR
jgi:transposase-like protein